MNLAEVLFLEMIADGDHRWQQPIAECMVVSAEIGR
jgi:hypothetical protein